MYIYQQKDWPTFTWNVEKLTSKLVTVRYQQGKLLGSMAALGYNFQRETFLEVLTTDVVKTSEIEGELLNPEQVRSSIARQLGMTIAHSVPSGRDIDGIVEIHLDAAQNYTAPLDKQRLLKWHSWLFPETDKYKYRIAVGRWRDGAKGAMQVVSGGLGREKVHFEAPEASKIEGEIKKFLDWYNQESDLDPVLKAAISHFWFVTIHPFEDGNGRIARAIADMQLAKADGSPQRFYSMSARIQKDWKEYYWILEESQKGTLDITNLLFWFLECLGHSLNTASELLEEVKKKARFWEKFTQVNLNDRQRLMLNKLLDGFDGKLTTVKWAKIAKCSHDTALRDILDLIEKKILYKEEAGGRSSSYGLVAIDIA